MSSVTSWKPTAQDKGLMWKILVEMAKALLVSKQVEMGPYDRRWVPPLVAGAANSLSPAAVAARLRETSWRPHGSLLRSDPSGGTRPCLQCWDTTKRAEMSMPGEGRRPPCMGPGQQECVTGQGHDISSVARPSALRLCSILVLSASPPSRWYALSVSRCGFAIWTTHCGSQRCPQFHAFMLSSVHILPKSRNEYV